MNQTDIRFKAFIRFVIDALKEVNEEKMRKNAIQKWQKSLKISKRL